VLAIIWLANYYDDMNDQLAVDSTENTQTGVNLTKTRSIFPVLATAIACAAIFGIGGYFLGTRSPLPQQNPEQKLAVTSPSPVPSATDMPSKQNPSVTPKPAKKITYKLPSGWQTEKDTSGRIEVGFDTSRYTAISGENRVGLSGIWVGKQGVDLHRLGWNKDFNITTYNGGSRHTELYKILGVTNPSTMDWTSPQYYSEREYSYSGWNCLVVNGVSISQYPVAWAYCPISSNEALVMAFDGYDWTEIEQQMAAVKLVK